jgi:molecular chaperone IbpA
MSNDVERLFALLSRNTIGFENLFYEFLARPTVTFPHYNVINENDYSYIVEVAVAGYAASDIDVFLGSNYQGGARRNMLTISTKTQGSTEQQEDPKTKSPHANPTFVHRGIAKRDFNLTFALPEYFEVKSAEFHNGLLVVRLLRNTPAPEQPKRIPITHWNNIPVGECRPVGPGITV